MQRSQAGIGKKLAEQYQHPPEALLSAAEIEVERAVLRVINERIDGKLRRMVTVQSVADEPFSDGGYPYDPAKRNDVDRVINRAGKKLEDAGLIHEPNSYNGKNGFRVVSESGRQAVSKIDFVAAKVRSQFSREMFHPSLPDAAWNAFRAGHYDTAVFEAFKAVESAVRTKAAGKNGIATSDFGAKLMEKAFDPSVGPLTDMSATPSRRRVDSNCSQGL